ncbi:MAG: hypothetical protein HZA50_08045 [Planctomycetes bacterium]|nr:hypothetical protein [Planctomycetota bacterium]
MAEPAQIETIETPNPRPMTRWFTGGLLFMAVLLPLLFLVSVRPEHLGGVLMAYLNCLVISLMCVYLVRKCSLQAIVPVLFLGFFAMSWPLPIIHLAIAEPDSAYETLYSTYSHQGNQVHFQFVLLIFLFFFMLGVLPFVGHRKTTVPGIEDRVSPESARAMASLVSIVAIFMISLHIFTQVFPISSALNYLAQGAFLYLVGLFITSGALFMYMSRLALMILLGILACAAGVYMIGNARSWAFYPFFGLAIGFMFLTAVSQKIKLGLLLLIIAVFPVVLVITNTTREVLGDVGFKDLGMRWQAMGQWKDVLAQGSTGARSSTRLFCEASHLIVTTTPDTRDYIGFDPYRFMTTLVSRLFIPGVISSRADYTNTEILPTYGIEITETSSVPIGIIGSFWVLGGMIPLIFGALATGAIIGLCARAIGNYENVSPLKALFVLSVLAPQLFEAPLSDIISLAKFLLWRMVAALILYNVFLGGLIGDTGRSEPAVHPA